MIKPIKFTPQLIENMLCRTAEQACDVDGTVRAIIDDVRANGDSALRKYSLAFDKVEIDNFRVSEQEFAEAEALVGREYTQILQRSAANIAEFHKKQLREGFEIEQDGCIIGQKVIPLESAGLYVPGGTAAYPSTVLMNAVPAKIAGVSRIVMVTPPLKNGKVKAEVLVAARIAGVDEVYKTGGAQAVAALAYGTESIPKADKITGPGNIYVATAKKMVFGICGIDMVAGPSEILVIADDGARARDVAADLLSQAEHDVRATAVLITDSAKLADEVSVELDRQCAALERAEIARKSLENNCKIIIADDLEEAVRLSDKLAPEHLELSVREPEKLLALVHNAGSVFLGYSTPEAVGDYYAGANHTLPTSGTARFSSPLGVEDFIKTTQYVKYTRKKLENVADDIITFAKSEGLTAHAQSVAVRFK